MRSDLADSISPFEILRLRFRLLRMTIFCHVELVETSLKITFSCGRRGTAFAVVEELLELFISFVYITK